MYCPECKSEYREGFETCAECGVPLVAGSPDESDEYESDEDESGLKVLLETTHPTFLNDLVVRLETESIPYVVQSGTALSLLVGNLISEHMPEDWKAMILVPGEHFEAADRIREEIEQSATATDESAPEE